MHALSESAIRGSFVNVTLRERKALALPSDLDELDWGRLDFLGWRDPRQPQIGYLVIPVDDEAVGVMLRLGGRQPRNRQLCSFCEDVFLPSDVAFFSAKLAGPAGRKGDTIGTLVCSDFACSKHVRMKPPAHMAGSDPEALRQERILTLQLHLEGFARRVLDR